MFQEYLFFGVDTKVFYAYRMLHLHKLINDVKEKHNLNHNRAMLLSDAFLGCLLLSSVLDYEERVNLRIQCGDHFTIGVETTFQAETRGYIECNEDSDVVKGIDQGTIDQFSLQIRTVRSQRNQQNLFQGTTLSTNSTIEQALNDHLRASYQMNTQLRIGSWTNQADQKLEAFGLIYQELPGIPQDVSSKLNQHIAALPPMKELYLKHSDPDELALRAIPDQTKAIKSVNPKFVCTCSLEKAENALQFFSQEDLDDMIAKSEDLAVKCHYCNTEHIVQVETIKKVKERVRAAL